jgi:hypothetical protein
MPDSTKNLSELVATLGVAREATTGAYERYKELKGIEDQVRYELELKLHEMGLRSAKGADFTASIAQKPSIVITHEPSVLDWLREAPDIETDHYIGLKAPEFKSLAISLLKGTGETIPGTTVEMKESLSIRANAKPKKAQE